MPVLRRIVEFHIPAAVDVQPVGVRTEPVLQLDTVEVVVDTVMVAGIVEVLEVDMMSAQQQELHLDTDWGRCILLCFPCFSSYF